MHFVSQTDGSDPSAALESISQDARVLTRGTGAAIALAHKGSMICRASVGNAPTLGARLDISSGISGECVRSGKTLRCDNSDSDPRVDAALCRRLGIHSILAAPILLGGEVVGILEVFSSQRFNFHEGDLAVVEHLAQTVFVVPPSAKTAPAAGSTPPITTTPPVKIAPSFNPIPPLKAAPAVSSTPPISTTPPAKTAPLVSTTPPVKIAPSFNAIPPVKIAPSFNPIPPLKAAPSVRTAPPVQTSPPVRAASPVKAAPAFKDIPPPQLLLILEPAWEVFFGNLIDLLLPPRTLPLKLTSRPAPFWPDVFVPARLPWDRFVQAVLLQVIMVAVLGLIDLGLSQRPQLRPRRLAFNKSDVIYYLPPEYMQSLRRESESPSRRTERSGGVRQAFISVHRDSGSRAPKSIPPPTLHLKQDARFRMMAWNPTAPAVPLSATMRSQRSTPATSVAAIAPPPDTSAVSRAQHLTLATPQVVQPAPSVNDSVRKMAGIGLGHVEVVRPAPEIHELGSLSKVSQPTLGKAAPVVPPPPSVHPSAHSMESISLGRLEVVRPAPQIPNEQRSPASAAQATLSREATAVVPPPPSVHQSIHPMETISLGHLEVVRPAPEIPNGQRSVSGTAQATLSRAATPVVPPPPAVGGLGNPGRRASAGRGAGPGADAQVVPPPPGLLQIAGSYLIDTPDGGAILVVPPAPSVGGLERPGGQSTGSLPGTMRVVPPAPLLQGAGGSARGTGSGIAVAVVPPAPAVGSLGQSGGRTLSSQRAAGMQMAPPKVGVQSGGDGTQGAKVMTRASGLPGGILPGELVGNGGEARADTKEPFEEKEISSAKELSVSFIGPALVAPRSSYFESFEVFIAEERLGRHQSRLIKLVYDFLPYQPRLSDYGPNYPAIENLRATRDPSCDEPFKQVVSSANTLQWSQAARVQLTASSAKQHQSTLACYRTTADDYRKAADRPRR
jgi:hypothetical protein